MSDGIRCPKCGCADLREADGTRGLRAEHKGKVGFWKIVKTVKIPGAVRRYRICRHCGKRVRTKEVLE